MTKRPRSGEDNTDDAALVKYEEYLHGFTGENKYPLIDPATSAWTMPIASADHGFTLFYVLGFKAFKEEYEATPSQTVINAQVPMFPEGKIFLRDNACVVRFPQTLQMVADQMQKETIRAVKQGNDEKCETAKNELFFMLCACYEDISKILQLSDVCHGDIKQRNVVMNNGIYFLIDPSSVYTQLRNKTHTEIGECAMLESQSDMRANVLCIEPLLKIYNCERKNNQQICTLFSPFALIKKGRNISAWQNGQYADCIALISMMANVVADFIMRSHKAFSEEIQSNLRKITQLLLSPGERHIDLAASCRYFAREFVEYVDQLDTEKHKGFEKVGGFEHLFDMLNRSRLLIGMNDTDQPMFEWIRDISISSYKAKHMQFWLSAIQNLTNVIMESKLLLSRAVIHLISDNYEAVVSWISNKTDKDRYEYTPIRYPPNISGHIIRARTRKINWKLSVRDEDLGSEIVMSNKIVSLLRCSTEVKAAYDLIEDKFATTLPCFGSDSEERRRENRTLAQLCARFCLGLAIFIEQIFPDISRGGYRKSQIDQMSQTNAAPLKIMGMIINGGDSHLAGLPFLLPNVLTTSLVNPEPANWKLRAATGNKHIFATTGHTVVDKNDILSVNTFCALNEDASLLGFDKLISSPKGAEDNRFFLYSILEANVPLEHQPCTSHNNGTIIKLAALVKQHATSTKQIGPN